LIIAFIYLVSISAFQPDSLSLTDSFGTFQKASSISASRDEFVFVSDAESNQLFKFSASGDLLMSFGGMGFGADELSSPQSIDASNGLDVFVCDQRNNRVQRYNLNLNFIASFDFNTYNLTADNSRKIFYPYGIAFLSTSEIFILADATAFKVVKLRSLDEVSAFFGSGVIYDRLVNPAKIIRGASLDVLILDKETDEIVNFDNYGTFVKRIKNPESTPIINIAYYNDNLYILTSKSLVIYDLKSNLYTRYYSFNSDSRAELIDLTVLNNYNVFILSPNTVYKYKLKN